MSRSILPRFPSRNSSKAKYSIICSDQPRNGETLVARLVADYHLHCQRETEILATGDIAHSLTMEGVVSERYDLIALPGKLQPAAVGPFGPELKRMLSVGSE
jgi:hypothetical protein